MLLNAWELAVKALLSKRRKTIYYPKQRGQPYRTLSLHDALGRAERFFPSAVSFLPVRKNLELLSTYRDNAVHFYNATGFEVMVYSLGQTAVMNLRDLFARVFRVDLGGEIPWQLLPIGLAPPVDPMIYLKGKKWRRDKRRAAIDQFASELMAATKEVTAAGEDTGRLLTTFRLRLESVKKIAKADAVIGVGAVGSASEAGPLAILRTVDPNITHPLRMREVLEKSAEKGKVINTHVFQAIAWKFKLKEDLKFCWRSKDGVLTRYSSEMVGFLVNLTLEDISRARSEYNRHLASRSKKSN